jgi:hypothetical protein
MTLVAATAVPDVGAGQRADVADERLDVGVAQEAEGRHPGTPERVTPVLDEVEEVPVGAGAHPDGVGEVPRPEQEQGRSPGAPAVHAVAGDAVGVEEAFSPVGTGRRMGGFEEPG